MCEKIIKAEKSVIPACDVSLELYEEIIKETCDAKGIGGCRIGFSLSLRYRLSKVVEIAREYTNKPLIYDHQKAGTDIPSTGKMFMDVCRDAEVDAVIIFPQAGPETEQAWIESALNSP